MLLFPLKFPNKKRKRVKNADAPSPPPPPPPALFWLVQSGGGDPTWAVWIVDSEGVTGTVNDPGNWNQFKVNGQHPTELIEVAGEEVTFAYPDNVNPGDGWQFVPGIPAADTDPPAPLSPQSGMVV
jgi:hypothetical protein